MTYEEIRYEARDAILTLTLNRPSRLNAFTEQMSQELVSAFDRADQDDEIRAVVLTAQAGDSVPGRTLVRTSRRAAHFADGTTASAKPA